MRIDDSAGFRLRSSVSGVFRQRNTPAWVKAEALKVLEGKDLFAIPLQHATIWLHEYTASLSARGLFPGIDYAIFKSRERLLSACPPWLLLRRPDLQEQRRIHGFNDELWARMDEEVRKRWTDGLTSPLTLHLVGEASNE